MLQERGPTVENLLNLFNGIARRIFVHNDQYKATGSSLWWGRSSHWDRLTALQILVPSPSTPGASIEYGLRVGMCSAVARECEGPLVAGWLLCALLLRGGCR